MPATKVRQQPLFTHFLHVSNSGGSSVCWLARTLLGRDRVAGSSALEDLNCNLKCKMPWNWNGRERCGFDTCAAFTSHVRSSRWVFVASEMYLEEADWSDAALPAPPLCPQVSYIAIIKDPLSRLGSEVARLAPGQFGFSPEELLWSWLPGCSEAGCDGPVSKSLRVRVRSHKNLASSLVLLDSDRCYAGHTTTICRTGLMGTPAISNYATRLLLGRQWFLCPPDRLDEGNAMRVATQMLGHFSLVLPSEALSSPAAIRTLAHMLLRPLAASETLTAMDTLRVESVVLNSSRGQNVHFVGERPDWLSVANISDGLRRVLLAHNRVDLHLYRLAQEGSRKLLQLPPSHYTHLGPNLGTRHPLTDL